MRDSEVVAHFVDRLLDEQQKFIYLLMCMKSSFVCGEIP
jgi:hypothetical protein